MAPGIQDSRNGRVLAIASRSPTRAQAFAEKFGIERAYGSYHELLDDADVEAVYIPLPNSMHKTWTIEAAAKGKHVLCEKPLACNAQEAQEMVSACREHGVTLMEGFVQRHQPQNSLVKKLIDEGRIGRVMWMTAVFSSGRPAPNDIRLSRALCGGILMDKGSYCVNTARFLLESEPISVLARADFGGETRVDERMTATLVFPGGQVVQFDCSFQLATGTWQQGYEVYGESGRIRVPTGFTQVELYHRGEILDVSFYVTDGSGEEKITCTGSHQYQLEAEYFADRVLQGEDIEWPSESGLANMKVLDAIHTSAREGRAVSL
jgi:predicted dehydrogenase